MTRRGVLVVSGTMLVAAFVALWPVRESGLSAESLPSRLSDAEYWKLVADFSEPNGFFRSDNLLSNEMGMQYVIPELVRITRPGRVYMGVGPEQNFTYITAVQPKMAFIVDVRRGNLDLQLMYKALFEMSADRADFYSRLFSKKRPDGLTAATSIQQIVDAYANLDTSEQLYNANLKAIDERLSVTHGFAISDEDKQGIEYVYHAFYWFGPGLTYRSSSQLQNNPNGGFGNYGFRGGPSPTYGDLLVATDEGGQMRGFLASEEKFNFMKDLEARNLLVPVVGNFSGPKAIRAVGKYVKSKGAMVSAFYLSNVEQYLNTQAWQDFCENVSALPLDATSTFIRSARGGRYGPGFGLISQLGNMAAETKSCGTGRYH